MEIALPTPQELSSFPGKFLRRLAAFSVCLPASVMMQFLLAGTSLAHPPGQPLVAHQAELVTILQTIL
jgi:hypothetical protein